MCHYHPQRTKNWKLLWVADLLVTTGRQEPKRRKKVLVLAIQRPGEAIKVPNMMALTIPTIDLRLPAPLKRKYGCGSSSAANIGLQVFVTAEVEKYCRPVA